ncbi:hypothetical protein MJG53_000566 [Ovis ammon polii x Ovis aries]|uniref:Uncharacterized protein n=1 Tax=Ovis ammon polii x Ovis aries TaxID=2918886 RepID=A0ACB9VHY3_9CETA|nr:hypothetical protein MJG53_000566 [Ovis ammon polii x Ovis aries]
MSDFNSNVDFPESPEPSDQEIEREKQQVQEKEDLGRGPEPSKACKEPVLADRVNRRRSRANLLTIFPLPELLRDWGDEGNPDVQEPKKEAANGHPPVQGLKDLVVFLYRVMDFVLEGEKLLEVKPVNSGIDTTTRSPVLPLCFSYSNIALIQPREEGDGAESVLVAFDPIEVASTQIYGSNFHILSSGEHMGRPMWMMIKIIVDGIVISKTCGDMVSHPPSPAQLTSPFLHRPFSALIFPGPCSTPDLCILRPISDVRIPFT